MVITATERCIEIDEVHPFGTGGLPRQRCIHWSAVTRFRTSDTLNESHCLAIGDIDRRK
jgi:hypothetical protein